MNQVLMGGRVLAGRPLDLGQNERSPLGDGLRAKRVSLATQVYVSVDGVRGGGFGCGFGLVSQRLRV